MKLKGKLKTIEESRRSRHNVWLLGFIVTIFTLWSAFAPLDEIVRGVGRVVSMTKNQVIQNLEGGILEEIFVIEGDTVEADEIVVKMDRTRFESAYQELLDQYSALSLRLFRLEAERDFTIDFVPQQEFLEHAPEHALSELQLFEARRAEFLSTVDSLSQAVKLNEAEVAILQNMLTNSAVPKITVIRAQQLATETKARLNAFQTEFEVKRANEYSETLGKVRQIQEQMIIRKDQLTRTDVRSPLHGVVNKIFATTVGGVIQPGESLMEILSLEDRLRIEGRIDPKDIGFLYIGMPATIKLTAFDYTIYGSLKGSVTHIGADTVVDENDRSQKHYYEILIGSVANLF